METGYRNECRPRMGAVCSFVRGTSAVSPQSPEPIEPSDPRDPRDRRDRRDQRELIDDPLAIHRLLLLTGALTIFKYTDYRGTHFSYSYSYSCRGFQNTENSEKHKMQNTVESSESRKRERANRVECRARDGSVEHLTFPARSEPIHPLDRPQTVNRLLAAALSTCSAALLSFSPSGTFTYTDTHVTGCSES